MPSHGDPHLERRTFLRRLGAALAGASAAAGCSPFGDRAREPSESGARIERVSALSIRSERWKLVGKNSRRDTHGRFARDRILRIETSAGVEGVGSSTAKKEDAARLLGADALSYYAPGDGMRSPLGSGDAPLWDLAGKLLEKPAWRLLGGEGPEWVPVYDGSIYFNDLEDSFPQKGVDRLLFEVDYAYQRGHRAFKIKVGRGAKWMEREAGLRRDAEVVQAIRKAVGPGVKLMVDANNGYDLQGAKRFLEEANDELYFVEEMFPESVDEDRELKEWLRARNWTTLVADGESAAESAHFAPYIEARALDVLQADIRRFGLTRLLELSRLARPAGIVLAPHNWGSYLGVYMQLALGRGIPNFLIAEQDPAGTDLFDDSGFELREGKMRVPDTPGLGPAPRWEAIGTRSKVDWQVAL